MNVTVRIAGVFLFAVSCALVGVLAWNTGLHERDGVDGSTIVCGPGGTPIEVGPSALVPDPADDSLTPLAFFTGGGNYMPRVHCMLNEAGSTDWPWVWGLLALNAIVITGYARIFVFWRRSYLEERPDDRNKKLMDLAWIFLLCAICGYASSIMMFVWPAYRLLALSLVPLAFFTWRFCGNLEDMKVSLSAKRLERELREALERRTTELEAEVAQRTVELREARDAERAASEAKTAFIASVSHEIRTPLNAIMGYSALLAGEELPRGERSQYAGVVERNGRHLATVINDVLDQSKIESRRLTIESAPCSVALIAADIHRLMEPKASEKGVRLTATTATGLPGKIIGDETRIRQVLLNLVSNAVKFTDEGSVEIGVDAETEGDACTVRLTVRDTGIGMTPEQCERVFEPFRQAEPGTTRRFGGTGLGLSISRSLCELMGGSLEVTSTPGGGSVFVAEIAARADHDAGWFDSIEAASSSTAEAAPDRPVRLGGRVLLADDSIDNRRLFALSLRRLGLGVSEACDGIEAIEAAAKAHAESRPFDLILMDIDMPRCDGETAMKRIRLAQPDRVIVALTAHTMDGIRETLIARGFDDYASKPIRRAELAGLCAKWIGERREAA
jgi:signal transduction histidine kinase